MSLRGHPTSSLTAPFFFFSAVQVVARIEAKRRPATRLPAAPALALVAPVPTSPPGGAPAGECPHTGGLSLLHRLRSALYRLPRDSLPVRQESPRLNSARIASLKQYCGVSSGLVA
jgi:hypothetical protein